MRQNILDKKNKYIVGVSGGVDSMALVDMLYKNNYQIIVCHVNYNYRHDSYVDQELVTNYCKQRNIPIHIHVETKSHSEGNFQMHARELRYNFYKEIASKHDTKKVILGHHYNDNIENVYMQYDRGSTLGYIGIQEVSHIFSLEIYRPLLHMYKEELYKYCVDNKVEYHEDYTNFENEFTRDYVRNTILPELDKREIDKLLNKASKHNVTYKEKTHLMQEVLSKYNEQGFIRLNEVGENILDVFLYQIIKEHVYPPMISKALIEEIIKQMKSDKPNIVVSIGINSQFIKEYDNIYIQQKKEVEKYCFEYDKITYISNPHFTLANDGPLNCGVFVEERDFPITIRCVQAGDKILTSGGTKKISRLFIDRKIPKGKRNVWPIVIASDGRVILVPNIAKNIKYLYSKPNLYVVK